MGTTTERLKSSVVLCLFLFTITVAGGVHQQTAATHSVASLSGLTMDMEDVNWPPVPPPPQP